MENKLLYQYEYEVKQKREAAINKVKDNILSLKEVLDIGFNNVYIENKYNNHHYNLFKDSENKYTIDNYYLEDEDILDAKVKYDYTDLYEDNGWGHFVELGVEFYNDKYYKMLADYIEKLEEEE